MSLIPAFDPLGLPAPVWFLLALKVFGFWVHMIFMGLWFAGLIVALLLFVSNGPYRLLSLRLMNRMPIILAFGINAGIVPLLFMQVLYPQFFYTSTILQAWYWFSVIVLIVIAYYGIYYYAYNINRPERRKTAILVGWLATVIFLFLGLVFSTEMQFLVTPERWVDFTYPSIGGTVLGNALAFDGIAIQRYLMVFGLSLPTVAAYFVFDRHFLLTDNKVSSQNFKGLILGLTFLGLVIFGTASLPYLRHIQPFLKGLGLWKTLAGLGPFLAFVTGFTYVVRPGKTTAGLLVLSQTLSLLFNAITRQIVQVRELSAYTDLSRLPLNLQLSPIALFLVAFVIGLIVLYYLLKIYISAASQTES